VACFGDRAQHCRAHSAASKRRGAFLAGKAAWQTPLRGLQGAFSLSICICFGSVPDRDQFGNCAVNSSLGSELLRSHSRACVGSRVLAENVSASTAHFRPLSEEFRKTNARFEAYLF